MGLPLFDIHLRNRFPHMRDRTKFYRSDRWSCHRRYRLGRNLRRQLYHYCMLRSSCKTSEIWSAPGQHVRYRLCMRTAYGRRFHGPFDMEMVLLHQSSSGRGCPRRSRYFLQTCGAKSSTLQSSTCCKVKTTRCPGYNCLHRIH